MANYSIPRFHWMFEGDSITLNSAGYVIEPVYIQSVNVSSCNINITSSDGSNLKLIAGVNVIVSGNALTTPSVMVDLETAANNYMTSIEV